MLPESPRRIQRGSHHELPLAEDVVVSKEPKTPPFESSQGAIPPALLAQTPHAPDRNCRPAYSVPNTPTQLWSLPMAVPQTTKASTTFDLSPPINETFKAHSQAAQYLAIGDSAGNSATPSSQGSQSWATDLIASLPVPEPPRRLRSPINLSLPSSPVPSGVFSSARESHRKLFHCSSALPEVPFSPISLSQTIPVSVVYFWAATAIAATGRSVGEGS
ncbi:hypothetical protein NM208_g5652 [Fusarium decemcellulare]|uniref:Uncharacterized protein n=1 Tax=Fusarium decemcellulare TaxID=57161 RepID=A0ACC1SG92_9HYPO|nr:hypothetical protein NM208_g5652 [Fusarium decemcellulare]